MRKLPIVTMAAIYVAAQADGNQDLADEMVADLSRLLGMIDANQAIAAARRDAALSRR